MPFDSESEDSKGVNDRHVSYSERYYLARNPANDGLVVLVYIRNKTQTGFEAYRGGGEESSGGGGNGGGGGGGEGRQRGEARAEAAREAAATAAVGKQVVGMEAAEVAA